MYGGLNSARYRTKKPECDEKKEKQKKNKGIKKNASSAKATEKSSHKHGNGDVCYNDQFCHGHEPTKKTKVIEGNHYELVQPNREKHHAKRRITDFNKLIAHVSRSNERRSSIHTNPNEPVTRRRKSSIGIRPNLTPILMANARKDFNLGTGNSSRNSLHQRASFSRNSSPYASPIVSSNVSSPYIVSPKDKFVNIAAKLKVLNKMTQPSQGQSRSRGERLKVNKDFDSSGSGTQGIDVHNQRHRHGNNLPKQASQQSQESNDSAQQHIINQQQHQQIQQLSQQQQHQHNQQQQHLQQQQKHHPQLVFTQAGNNEIYHGDLKNNSQFPSSSSFHTKSKLLECIDGSPNLYES